MPNYEIQSHNQLKIMKTSPNNSTKKTCNKNQFFSLLLKTDFTKNIQTIGRRMTLITDTERKNSRKKNVFRSISALINKPKKKRKKQQEPDALNCRFWYHPVTTNSLNILSIFSLTLQNYKLFRFCFPGCVFTRSNLHISKS